MITQRPWWFHATPDIQKPLPPRPRWSVRSLNTIVCSAVYSSGRHNAISHGTRDAGKTRRVRRFPPPCPAVCSHRHLHHHGGTKTLRVPLLICSPGAPQTRTPATDYYYIQSRRGLYPPLTDLGTLATGITALRYAGGTGVVGDTPNITFMRSAPRALPRTVPPDDDQSSAWRTARPSRLAREFSLETN